MQKECMTMTMYENILEVINGLGIPTAWHSFVKVPSEHTFLTYSTPSVDFDGGDEYAMFKNIVMEVNFFYKDGKTESDFELESDFENSVRFVGSFKKKTGFNSSDGLFYSVYTFEFGEIY